MSDDTKMCQNVISAQRTPNKWQHTSSNMTEGKICVLVSCMLHGTTDE